MKKFCYTTEPVNEILTEVAIYKYGDGVPKLVEIMIHDPKLGISIKHNVESYINTTLCRSGYTVK